jgi:DNA mismatch repair protein MutS
VKTDSLTPAMRQYERFKREHPDAILLFRMGDFYEMFFDDAKTASRVLGLTLTSRTKGIPMAGFPWHMASSYIQKLIRANFRVAVCEQVEDPKEAKGLVDRDVVQVITPGTVLDENFLESRQANFLASVFADGGRAGIAWVDLSTGQFLVHEIPAADLGEMLSMLTPSEILLPESGAPDEPRAPWLTETTAMVSRAPLWTFGRDEAHKCLTRHFRTSGLDGFGCEGLDVGLSAAGALMAYLNETQKVRLSHITRLLRYHPESFMQLDRSTRYSLELVRTMRSGEREGSLLWVIDRTVTSMGARLLHGWVLSPLSEVERIRERLDGVEEFFTQGLRRGEFRDALKSVYDVERLTSRVATGRANARDLLVLGQSMSAIPALKQHLADARSSMVVALRDQVDPVEELAELVRRAVAPDPPMSLHDGGLVRQGYSPELDELRSIAGGGKQWLVDYQASEAKRTGIPSLRVGFNSVFGYYIEITHTHAEKVPDNYTRKQTLKNAERYITPELKEYESKVLSADERARKLEYDLFVEVREKAAAFVERLQRTAHALATLDVLSALAQVAAENRYVRPQITEDIVILIRDGRHPVLEQMLVGEKFVPNDTKLDSEKRQLAVITGPNMAGKSTYIRQVALIVLMAQMGSFVPASEATVGVADHIFTRVGASDELARGQSTFMVEMIEAANILNNATRRSLIILDEIGRGTSTFDGLAIAWAVGEHIHEKVGARTLFATHYHELTELALLLPRVVNCNVAVREWKDDVIFLRKIVEGATDKSYGIHVARLAGIPPEVVGRARVILANLEEEELDLRGKPKLAQSEGPRSGASAHVQLGFFGPQPDPVREEIERLDVDGMTPVEALLKLKELREKLTRER